MLEVARYDAARKASWDDFIARSKNATFLFFRDYLEYHADRFQDHSLLFKRDGEIVALLPANEKDGALASHGGLTYGGVLGDRRMTAALMLDVFGALLAYMRDAGLARLLYKAIPPIYHSAPAEEDLYALFRLGARLVRRDLSSTIRMAERLPLTKGRRWAISKARGSVEIRRGEDFAAFMAIEEEVLAKRHGTRPVHTAAEIALLASRFPENVKLFGAYKGGALLGGTIIYETSEVAHAQYIAASDEGRRAFALDGLFAHLLDDVYREKRFFDFGISTTDGGRTLNEGLAENKESWGARSTVYDFYELEVR